MKKVKLTLVKSLILEAVKDETHIKSQIDKAMSTEATKLAFQEEAGDAEYHERKLNRGIHTSLSQLKSELSDYLDTNSQVKGNNVIATVNDDLDSITIELFVSDRFNESFTNDLAKLCSKYIEDATLTLWWGTFNQAQMQFYAALQASDLLAIQKCFAKLPPKRAVIPYTTSIETVGSTITIEQGETEEITYTIDEYAIDDIQFRVSNRNVCVSVDENSFVIKGVFTGHSKLRLFSQHDESVHKDIDVIVTEPSTI